MIRFDAVNKWYTPHHQCLTDITAEVNKGEVVVLCGPSGSGKTTLIRTINRLEPIQGGRITVNGQDTQAKGADLNRMRRDIGFVFQQFNLFPHMSVLDKRPTRFWNVSGWRTRRGLFPGSFRAGRPSGWPSRGRWPWTRRSSSSMNPHRRSTPRWWGRCCR